MAGILTGWQSLDDTAGEGATIIEDVESSVDSSFFENSYFPYNVIP